MGDVIRHLRKAALLQEACGLTDGQLLECFLARRDEAAFAVLVRRHGPMVLGVCRRLLRHEQDAEDAFQATFLVLARKAASVRSREVVGHWLYGVAHRTALKARATSARRRAREQQMKDMPEPETPGDDGWRELLPLLDRELARLPERYRVAVVLCDLEGVTRREAARRLNLPEGTLSGRLTTARRLLAKRLSRYGLAVSGGALAAALSGKAASACVPGALAVSTARAAVLLAAGQGMAAGAVPARVVTLAEGVIKTMFLLKLRAFVAVAVVAFVGAGVVGLAYRTTAAEPGKTAGATQSAAAGAPAADDLDALRLEVEALRKELRATRERVKALEDRVQGLQEKGGAQPKPGWGAPDVPDEKALNHARQSARFFLESSGTAPKPPGAADPLAEAEAALKKLRANPDDRQAADALERALRRLKERAKPEGQRVNPEEGP